MNTSPATYHVDVATGGPAFRTPFGTNRRAALDFWRANGGMVVMVKSGRCYTIRSGADHDAYKRALAS